MAKTKSPQSAAHLTAASKRLVYDRVGRLLESIGTLQTRLGDRPAIPEPTLKGAHRRPDRLTAEVPWLSQAHDLLSERLTAARESVDTSDHDAQDSGALFQDVAKQLRGGFKTMSGAAETNEAVYGGAFKAAFPHGKVADIGTSPEAFAESLARTLKAIRSIPAKKRPALAELEPVLAKLDAQVAQAPSAGASDQAHEALMEAEALALRQVAIVRREAESQYVDQPDLVHHLFPIARPRKGKKPAKTDGTSGPAKVVK